MMPPARKGSKAGESTCGVCFATNVGSANPNPSPNPSPNLTLTAGKIHGPCFLMDLKMGHKICRTN